MQINREEIPEILKNSEFYRNQDQEEEIFVPLEYYKFETIQDKLKTYHFWNVDKLPDDIIEYLLLGGESELYQEIREMPFSTVEEKAQTLKKLKYKGNYFFLGKDRDEVIVHCGDLEKLKTIELKEKYISIFAENGNLECLKYCHENGCTLNKKTCSSAAFNGHLDCLKYAHENGCPWDEYTCSKAAEEGYLDCLKYAHENSCPWDEFSCEYAAKNGHLECLKYAHKNGCLWDMCTCLNAAQNGHLECLKYAHENGCPWNECVYLDAKQNGHLDCVKYAAEHGCIWGKNTCLSKLTDIFSNCKTCELRLRRTYS